VTLRLLQRPVNSEAQPTTSVIVVISADSSAARIHNRLLSGETVNIAPDCTKNDVSSRTRKSDLGGVKLMPPSPSRNVVSTNSLVLVAKNNFCSKPQFGDTPVLMGLFAVPEDAHQTPAGGAGQVVGVCGG
jgi:hypothetical protein